MTAKKSDSTGTQECTERREGWHLRAELAFLNHGSFGALHDALHEKARELEGQIEADPVHFFLEDYLPLLDQSRTRLANFVGGTPSELAFVSNATEGINACLKSVCAARRQGSILVTSLGYNACNNAALYYAELFGMRVIHAEVDIDCQTSEEAFEAIVGAIQADTKVAMVDHITSATALTLPVQELCAEFRERGIVSIIDGAHAPGLIDLDLASLGADFYVANLHKWVCAPRGSAFVFASDGLQGALRPAIISHGANLQSAGRSRFHSEFDWVGTKNPIPWLCVPAAIDFLESFAGGLEGIRRDAHALSEKLERALRDELDMHVHSPLSPRQLLTFELPMPWTPPKPNALYRTPLQCALEANHQVQVPIIPIAEKRIHLLRVSLWAHTRERDIDSLVYGLKSELPKLV